MKNSRNLSLIVLTFLTLALGAVAIFIGIKVSQQNQAPINSSADSLSACGSPCGGSVGCQSGSTCASLNGITCSTANGNDAIYLCVPNSTSLSGFSIAQCSSNVNNVSKYVSINGVNATSTQIQQACSSPATCTNGATNPPTCNTCPTGQSFNTNNICAVNTATLTPCTNGATNPPTCNTCPVGQALSTSNICTTTNTTTQTVATPTDTCTNGTINPPTCNTCGVGLVLNGNNFCVSSACPNGANNPPDCNTCIVGLVFSNFSCVQPPEQSQQKVVVPAHVECRDQGGPGYPISGATILLQEPDGSLVNQTTDSNGNTDFVAWTSSSPIAVRFKALPSSGQLSTGQAYSSLVGNPQATNCSNGLATSCKGNGVSQGSFCSTGSISYEYCTLNNASIPAAQSFNFSFSGCTPGVAARPIRLPNTAVFSDRLDPLIFGLMALFIGVVGLRFDLVRKLSSSLGNFKFKFNVHSSEESEKLTESILQRRYVQYKKTEYYSDEKKENTSNFPNEVKNNNSIKHTSGSNNIRYISKAKDRN